MTGIREDFPHDDVERWMAGFDRAVAKVDELPPDDVATRGVILDDALVTVLAVKLLSLVDPSADWVRRDLPPFLAHVRAVLRQHRRDLAAVMARLDLEMWQRNADGWYKASMKRSEVQVLADDVDTDDGERPLVTHDELDELDDEMREIGPGIAPLPDRVIPRGLPDSHWWWSLPAGPPEEDDYSY